MHDVLTKNNDEAIPKAKIWINQPSVFLHSWNFSYRNCATLTPLEILKYLESELDASSMTLSVFLFEFFPTFPPILKISLSAKMQYWKKFIFFKITYSYKTLQNLLVKYSYSQSFSKTAFAFSKWCPGFVSDKLFQNYQLEFLQTLLKKKLYVCSKLLWNQFTGLCFSSFYDYSNLHICIYVQVTSLQKAGFWIHRDVFNRKSISNDIMH